MRLATVLNRFYIWLLLLAVGCAGSPTPAGKKKKPSPANPNPQAEKNSSPVPGKKGPVASGFDYEAYIKKHHIEKTARQQELAEKKKKAEYQRMLREMGMQLQKKWKDNKGVSQKSYREALVAYRRLELKTAWTTIRRCLSANPRHVSGQKLQRRIEFLLGKRPVLISDAVRILEEEARLMNGFRREWLDQRFQKGRNQFDRGNYSAAKKSFQYVELALNWAEQRNILPQSLKKHQKQSQIYLKKIARKVQKP